MVKKMSRKEDAFWKDLAFRMAKHIGLSIQEKWKKIRSNCSKKIRCCMVVDHIRYVWPYVIMHKNNWKDIVTTLCSPMLDIAGFHRNIFTGLSLDVSQITGKSAQHVIDVELAGFGDVVDAIKKGKI